MSDAVIDAKPNLLIGSPTEPANQSTCISNMGIDFASTKYIWDPFE